MNLENVNQVIKKLPDDSQDAIVELISLKTEDDMDKVLNKLTSMEAKFDTKIEALKWFNVTLIILCLGIIFKLIL